MSGRKRFIAVTACIAGVTLGAIGVAAAQQIPLPGTSIPKYVEPLPVFTPESRVDGTKPLKVTMEEFQQLVLPANLYPECFELGTYVWGYKIEELDPDGAVHRTLGPHYPAVTVDAQRGVPTTMTFVNDLFSSSFLANYPGGGGPPVWAVDQTLNWADPLPSFPDFTPYRGPIPACVHLHGGEVPSAFDGGPDAWFTADENGDGKPDYTGPGYVTNVYKYPNDSEAATGWFHDHGLGVTRLNPFLGLAAFFLVRDPAHEPADLPGGAYEIEIAIQDRLFDTNGQFIFPANGVNPAVHPFWMPEYFGDAIVVNGKTWPFLNVEPRRYRFRLLNGSNARFYNLSFLDRATNTRLPFWVIGTEGGYLDAPAPVTYLTMGTGERYDIVVDFTNSANATLTLDNTGRAPFPNGAPVDPRTTGQIMQFRVNLPLAEEDVSCNPAAGACLLRPTNPIVRLNPDPALVPTRRLTLNEEQGPGGPLEMLINNTKLGVLGVDPNKDERPRVGATEIWEIINLTADTHPMHTHLVNFQVLSRQRLNLNRYQTAYDASFPGGVYIAGYGPPLAYGNCLPGTVCGGNPDPTPYLQGKPVPPALEESGWKDTAKMNPGEVTRIAVRWAPTDASLEEAQPGRNLFPFDPTARLGEIDEFGYPGGPGYVWHCHIIDHEDNEMMKRYEVVP